MKIRDLNELMQPQQTRPPLERRPAPHEQAPPVVNVKLSSLATFLKDMRSENGQEQGLRTSEIDRARSDIERGTLIDDLDSALDSLLMEI